nr:dicarboxylate/amino acid:cation symporter [Actinomycetales bacterium]
MSSSPTAERTRRLRLPSFSAQILIALVLGVILGWLALTMGAHADGSSNWLATTLSTIGSSFVALLRAIVPPLVFLAIVASIANLRGVANGARLAGQTLIWFATTALISVGIGIGLGLIMQPGAHTSVSADAAAMPSRTGSWLGFLEGLIPSNFLGLAVSSRPAVTDGVVTGVSSSVNFNVLQIIVLALVVGVAALRSGSKAEPFLSFTRSALHVVQKVLWWIIRLAPLGTIGLVGNAIAAYGWSSLASLGMFSIAIYVGLALVLFGVYPILLRAHGLSIRRYFQGAWPALQLAFVSRSSIGTLPLTERVTSGSLGVPRGYASFAVPLGATTKMDGCASIYPAIAAIFVAQFFGLSLSALDYVLIAFVSVVGSAATAGLTGATTMLTLTLATLGLPLEGVGLLLAVDPILDMGRTATNVAGQILVLVIVAKREGILDEDQYNSAHGQDLFAEVVAEMAAGAVAAADHAAVADVELVSAGVAAGSAETGDAGTAPPAGHSHHRTSSGA